MKHKFAANVRNDQANSRRTSLVAAKIRRPKASRQIDTVQRTRALLACIAI